MWAFPGVLPLPKYFRKILTVPEYKRLNNNKLFYLYFYITCNYMYFGFFWNVACLLKDGTVFARFWVQEDSHEYFVDRIELVCCCFY